MSIFNAVVDAGVGLVNAAAQGIADVIQAIASTDVGTIVIVVLILLAGKAVLDKVNEKKK